MTRGKAPKREAALIEIIKQAGALGIRTQPLAKISGINSSNIGTALAPAIARGAVVVCVVNPGPNGTGRPTNEYRIGGGMAPPAFKPLDPRKTGAAIGQAHHRTHGAEAAPGTLPERMPTTPVLLSSTTPQPAVGGALRDRETAPRAINTGSAQSDSTSADERAVTSEQETPRPAPERRGMGPAPAKASAGDVSITIDDAGVLVIGTNEGVIELQPKKCQRLGHFMVGSQGIWNPF